MCRSPRIRSHGMRRLPIARRKIWQRLRAWLNRKLMLQTLLRSLLWTSLSTSGASTRCLPPTLSGILTCALILSGATLSRPLGSLMPVGRIHNFLPCAATPRASRHGSSRHLHADSTSPRWRLVRSHCCVDAGNELEIATVMLKQRSFQLGQLGLRKNGLTNSMKVPAMSRTSTSSALRSAPRCPRRTAATGARRTGLYARIQ